VQKIEDDYGIKLGQSSRGRPKKTEEWLKNNHSGTFFQKNNHSGTFFEEWLKNNHSGTFFRSASLDPPYG